MDNAVTTINGDFAVAMSAADVINQVKLIQNIYKEVLQKDVHYGIIPGCDKPTLLQPGAQKMLLTFRLSPMFEIETNNLPNGHREHIVKCVLTQINKNAVWGSGVGSASTMESKHRYRNVADFELTGNPIPADSKEKKKEYRRQGYGMKKVDGVWEWVKYKDSVREENPDIADTYNTVLKMAKKRAMVDATLNSLACGDIFTQDMEDLLPEGTIETTVKHEDEEVDKSGQNGEEKKKLDELVDIMGELAGRQTYKNMLAGLGHEYADEITDTAVMVKAYESITDLVKQAKERAAKAKKSNAAELGKEVADALKGNLKPGDSVDGLPFNDDPKLSEAQQKFSDLLMQTVANQDEFTRELIRLTSFVGRDGKLFEGYWHVGDMSDRAADVARHILEAEIAVEKRGQ